MITRTRWIAGLATLALAAASTGLATGKAAYNVKLSVPTTPVRDGQRVDLRVYGDAIDRVGMDLYTSGHACLQSWGAEVELAKAGRARLRLYEPVQGAFSRHFDLLEGGKGTHYACAYLFRTRGPDETIAHAAAPWHVR
jgi:hypothetical protein